MPFTFSHPAIILPFLKNKNFSATAIVFGSISPDLIYFFRTKAENDDSHTFIGILVLDLPLALIAMFVFHQIIKKPLIENLPSFFQSRLEDLKNSNWLAYFKSNVLKVLLSFLIGTISHLLWDAFTHADGYFVERIDFMNKVIYDYHIFDVAQYSNSLLGLLIITFYLYIQPTSSIRISKISLKFWVYSIVFTIAVFGLRCYFDLSLDIFVYKVASVLFSSMLGVTLSCLIYKKKKTI